MEKDEISFEDGKKFSETREAQFQEQESDTGSIEDYYANDYWSNRRFLSPILGTIRAVVSYIGNLIHEAVSTLVFGQHNQSTSAAYMQGYTRALKKTKEQKDKDVENEKTEKESPEKNRNKQDEELDHKERDREAGILLSDKFIQKQLKNIDILAFPSKDEDRILLAFQNKALQRERFGSMTKTDLIKGNADRLAASLYHIRLKTADSKVNLQELRMESAIDAVLTSASISAYAYADERELANEDGIMIDIAKTDVQVMNGAVQIKIENDPTLPDMAQIYYNGTHIGNCEWKHLEHPDVRSQIKDHIMKEYRREVQTHHRIGNMKGKDFQGFEFFQNRKGTITVIKKNGPEKSTLGNYQFQSTKDISSLANRINQELGRVYDGSGREFYNDFQLQTDTGVQPITGESIAYTIAAISNPSMEQVQNNSEQYLNPLTQQFEPGGAAHLSITHDLHGVSIKQNLPAMEADHMVMKQKIVGEFVHASDLSQKTLNQLVTDIQTANLENVNIREVIPDHIRIQDGIYISPIMNDEEAKEILKQNALDERITVFQEQIKDEQEFIMDIGDMSELQAEIDVMQQESEEMDFDPEL